MNIKSEISFGFKPDVEKINFFKNESIDQLKISYRLKFIGFYEALNQEDKDKEKILNKLISEGINTYEGDNSFEFFILLFSKCLNKKMYTICFHYFLKILKLLI